MWKALLACVATLLASVAAQQERCPPGLIVDHCNNIPNDPPLPECLDDPYRPTVFGELWTFPYEQGAQVLNVLGHDGRLNVWLGGQQTNMSDGQPGPQRSFWKSDDGGLSFVEDQRPPGAMNSMAWGEEGLMVGSWWQWDFEGGTSFAQFRYHGEDEWYASEIVGWADHLKAITINERGTQYVNGTFYITGFSYYDILPPTPEDPWSECLLGRTDDFGRTWTWNRFPVPENKGVFETWMFEDKMHGIAIGGVHYSGYDYDYLAYILVTEDGGVTWEETHSDTGSYTFTDIDCVGSTCWVTGLGLGNTGSEHIGFVWRSDDLGHTWDEQLLITGSATAYSHIWHVHCTSINKCFAEGDYWSGILTLYVTEDGGETWWVAYEPNCLEHNYIHDMYSVDGVLYMVASEPHFNDPGLPSQGMQTGILRLDEPAKKN